MINREIINRQNTGMTGLVAPVNDNAIHKRAEKLAQSITILASEFEFKLNTNSGQKSFFYIWEKKLKDKIDEKPISKAEYASLYASAPILLYQIITGNKTIKDAYTHAKKHGFIGSDDKETTRIEALTQILADSYQNPEYSNGKWCSAMIALSKVAKLGLILADKGIADEEIPKSINVTKFTRTQQHIDNIKKISDQLTQTATKEHSIDVSEEFYGSLKRETQARINTTLRKNDDEISTLEKLLMQKLLEGTLETQIPTIGTDEVTANTVIPEKLNLDPSNREDCGIQIGMGVIRNDKPTSGVPLCGFMNYILQTEYTRKAFNFKGTSTIFTSLPHRALTEKLGNAGKEREDYLFNLTTNMVSNFPGETPQFYQVLRKQHFIDQELNPLTIDDFTPAEQKQLKAIVPEDKDIQYFFMESNMIDILRDNYSNIVKVSWKNTSHCCTEQTFDELHEKVKKIKTNGSGMSYVYFKAPHTFKGKTIAPYALDNDEAENVIIAEDMENPDGQKYLDKAKGDLNIDDAFKVGAAQKYGLFGTKLAYLMLKYGEKKKGQNAIREMLDTINNVKIIYGDTIIESPEKRQDVSTDPKDFKETHAFICENMQYIYENYLKEPNKDVLKEYGNGKAFAKAVDAQQKTLSVTTINNNQVPPHAHAALGLTIIQKQATKVRT